MSACCKSWSTRSCESHGMLRGFEGGLRASFDFRRVKAFYSHRFYHVASFSLRHIASSSREGNLSHRLKQFLSRMLYSRAEPGVVESRLTLSGSRRHHRPHTPTPFLLVSFLAHCRRSRLPLLLFLFRDIGIRDNMSNLIPSLEGFAKAGRSIHNPVSTPGAGLLAPNSCGMQYFHGLWLFCYRVPLRLPLA
jgi:hypothetical protein